MSEPGNSIGVLDSGVGGLSVLREIHHLLPNHPTLYLADQAHLPYGPRPPEQIRTFVTDIARFLVERGAAVVVIACNAASAASLHDLRARFPNVPFVGMEPAVKPAAEATRSGAIGVLTTQATANGPLYRRVLSRYAANVRVMTQIAPELVQMVEEGSQHTPRSQQVIRKYVQPLVEAGADQIALACTHFPFLLDELQQATGEGVRLIDPSPAIARQTARIWPAGRTPGSGENVYFTTGSPADFRQMLARLIGVDAPVNGVCWSPDLHLYDCARTGSPGTLSAG